jgi:uncharacterized protein (DUF433 family)
MDELITVDLEVLGGTPVFSGTRVPIRTLFEYLEDNFTIEQFVEHFPTVTIEAGRKVLEQSEIALLGRKSA